MSKMIETDNNGHVRRLGDKQIKLPAGHKFIGADKSYKERTKKLSAVNRASLRRNESYEMGCVVADDREESLIHSPPPSSSISGASSKKFKLPRKQFFYDCDGVNHVSVPRKLRSAMKKRNGESTSPPFPDSKKLNYSGGGVKSHKRVGIKRSKLNPKQGGPNWSLQQSNGPITKDEEEVVETLYALAKMFPDNKTDSKSITGCASLDASASVLTGPSDSNTHELKVALEDLNADCLSKTDEIVSLASDVERLPEETVKACSLNGPSIHEVSNFSSSEKIHGLDSSIDQVKLNKMFDINEEQKPPPGNSVNFCFPLEIHQDNINEKQKPPPGNSVNFFFPLEIHQDNGKVKQPAKLETSLLETKPDISLGLTTIFGQLDQQHRTNEPKNNASWSSFSSTSFSTSHSPLSQSCAAKVPAWHGSLQNGTSTGNDFKVSTDQRSWKKCASHVHISRLIKALQTPGTKESLELLPNKLKPQDILKQGVLMTINDFSSIKNDLNGVTSPSSVIKTTKTSQNDTKSGNLQHLRLQQDHSQADLASGAYTSQKQTFNFLSLSAGGGGIESNISYNRAGHSESLAKVQIPYHTQNPTLVPFSMYQSRGASAYPFQPSAAAAAQQAQHQLPSHFSSAYCGPHASPRGLTKQQQQQLWAAQLTQYRNTGTSPAIMHFPSWQNGRQDPSAMIQCITPSPPAVEVLGPKYPHITHHHHQQHQNLHQHQHQHHQQQQFAGFSLQHGRMKRQDHHLSSVYEGTEVGFRASGSALPIQLLCNERL